MDNSINRIKFNGGSYYITLGNTAIHIPKKAIVDRGKPILLGSIIGTDFALNYSEKSGYYLRQKNDNRKSIFSVSITDVESHAETRILAYVGLGYDPLVIKYNRIYNHKSISSALVYCEAKNFKILEEQYVRSTNECIYRVITISNTAADETVYKVNHETHDMDSALAYIGR